MTLAEFKQLHGVSTINLWKTQEGSKTDYAGNAIGKTGKLDIIASTKGFNPQSPIFVYDIVVDDIDQDSGEVKGAKTLYVLSNKSGKEPALTL